MIINNVPYVPDKEEKYATCQGPPTVMMVLKHFLPDLNLTFNELYDKLGYSKGEWFFEMYMVEFFDKLGVSSNYYSTRKLTICSDSFCFRKISGLDFNNEKHKSEFNLQHYNSSVRYVISNNLFHHKKDIGISFIKKQIDDLKLVIVTVNRNKYLDKNGYKGHFMLIKGYTSDSFICNDAYFGENISIPFSKFLEIFYYINWIFPDDSKEYVRDIVVIG